MDLPAIELRLLRDNAMLWSAMLAAAAGQALLRETDAAGAIGIVTWEQASRAEVRELAALRDDHDGPVVAIVRDLPLTRGSRVLAARVEGSVLAGDMERSLVPTLQAVLVGQCVVPLSVRRLADRPALSPRERQVLAMVVLESSNAEIAKRLVVSEANVKSHLTSAFSKLGVTSRSEATELILDAESGLGLGILRITPEE